MDESRQDVSKYFCVGNTVMFHAEPQCKDCPRHKSTFRGWVAGKNVLLDRPQDLTGNFVSLREGQDCAIRFIHGGRACAFTAKVQEFDLRSSAPCVRVSWPEKVRSTAFRRFERLALRVSCTVEGFDAGPVEGEIRDISLGGGAVLSPVACPLETEVFLSFVLPDGARISPIGAMVRSCTERGRQYLLGCEFKEGQGHLESDIAFYIRSTLERQGEDGGLDEELPTVLVIDSDPKPGEQLRNNLEKLAADVQLSGTALDGIYKIRAASPDIIVVCEELPDLDGSALCGLIARNGGPNPPKIFLYGVGAVAGLVEEDLIAGYFPRSPKMEANLAASVRDALRALK